MKTFRFFILGWAGLAALHAYPCHAQQPPDNARLWELARKFVQTVGKDMDAADGYLAGMSPEEIKARPQFDSIPDGELLVLQLTLEEKGKNGNKLRLSNPVTGFKQGYDVMLSLSDLSYAASFPIQVNGDTGLAEGWYIRKGKDFRIDIAAGVATLDGTPHPFTSDDAFAQDGDIYVRSKALASWMGFDVFTDPRRQVMHIATETRWPPQEKVLRASRGRNKNAFPDPEQPFREEGYKLVGTAPSADVAIRHSLRKTESRKPETRTTYSVQASGDLLGHSAKSTINGNDEETLTSVTLGFSRISEDEDLLGPLKARFYEFNDVSTVNVPFAGSAPRERGVHITNKNPYITYDTVTQIEGDAPVGWDVELYRDDSYVDGVMVEEDGRFTFTDVTLYAGTNTFRIVKYGPHGETEEEERTLSVAPSSFGGGGLYDVSLTQQNTKTYDSAPSHDPDRGTPHLSAIYQKQVTSTLALSGGVKARQESGDQRAYMQGGAVAVVGATILNADAVVTNEGAYTGVLTGRRSLGEHNVSATTRYSSEGYDPNAFSRAAPPPATWTGSTQVSGPLLSGARALGSYNARIGASRDGNGNSSGFLGLDLGRRFNDIFAVHNIQYEITEKKKPVESSVRNLDGFLSLRGRIPGSFTWRTSVGYELSPETEIDRYNLSLSRNFSDRLTGTLDIDHEPRENYTSGELSASWHHDKVILSPTLRYDSDQAIAALVNARFGISRNPYANEFVMKGASLNNRGGVAAFVYLDKNGDGVFSGGDEPLPDAFVEAVQSHRSGLTNESGEAFIPDLPTNRITDIVVHDSSSFDINWVSGIPGVAVRPREGHVTRIEFPILRGGEIDGTAMVERENLDPRPLRNVRFNLYDLDGRLAKTAHTAGDGYYLMEKVPPGEYYLMLDESDARANNLVRPLPTRISIGYEGAVLSNTNFTFARGDKDVSLAIAPDLSDWLEANPQANIAALDRDNMAILNLGSYHSRLLATLTWYRLKLGQGAALAGARLLLEPSRGNPSSRTGTITLRAVLPDGGLDSAYETCKALNFNGFTCGVELLPRALRREAAARPAANG